MAWLVGSCLIALVAVSCGPSPEPQPTAEEYDRAIRLGADWFLENQNEDFLHYEFYVNEDRHGEERMPMRELGTLWAVAKAANYLDDPELHGLAQRGFAYFESHFERDESGDFMYVNLTPEWIGLGYSAFVILALLEMEHPRRDEYLEQFANGILSLQEESGEYRTFFYSNEESNQDFFPGEAALALMLLYEQSGDERWLDSVKRSFSHYSAYWSDRNTTSFASWQIQAYARLHATTKFERVRRFVFEMADFLIDYHRPRLSCAEFRLNGVFVGSRIEGLNQAYELARDRGASERAECYRSFIREASAYLVRLQLTDPAQHPPRAIGGFPGDKEPLLRVDRNQHVVAALIDARRLGLLD